MPKKFHRLTRLNIRKLRHEKSITENGITAYKLPNGDVRYSVNVMVDGQRIHRVIGLASEGVTRTQAEQFIEGIRTKARENRLNLPKGRKIRATVVSASRSYLAQQEMTGGKNLVAKRRHMKKRLVPHFGKSHVDALTTADIEKYKQMRTSEGATTATVNRELATLSHFLRACVEMKLISQIPARIRKFQESGGRIIALTDEECSALLNAAIADPDPDCWLFVLFGLHTGMRHSEILRTRFEHVDFSNRRLLIPSAKAGSRIQPLTQELTDVLARQQMALEEKDGWIFQTPRPSQSGTGHRHRMDKPFRRAVLTAGLNPDQITPHVMRHTAITKLVQEGVDLPTIQSISGHKTVNMVLKYTHVHGRHIDNAMSKLALKNSVG